MDNHWWDRQNFPLMQYMKFLNTAPKIFWTTKKGKATPRVVYAYLMLTPYLMPPRKFPKAWS